MGKKGGGGDHMSAKWLRSRQWDNETFPKWAWPAKAALRAFSSIWLAVVLLSLVIVYATLASVPIGLLALLLTYIVYALTVLLTVGVLAGIPIAAMWRLLGNAGRGLRFTITFFSLITLLVFALVFWHNLLWPLLRYDGHAGSGLRLFASFVEANKAITLRRLPMIEMSELEFYSWWPMRLILMLFVINMITATVRRIEFKFVNIGVLTVHTGIVVMALGSLYYNRLKQEGDTLLMAGEPDQSGSPVIGPPVGAFYDNTDVALWVGRGGSWEQMALRRIPRYNDYGLDALSLEGARQAVNKQEAMPRPATSRSLSREVSRHPLSKLDDDLQFQVIGYASYAESDDDWIQAPSPANPAAHNPLRFINLISDLPDQQGRVHTEPLLNFFFLPQIPAYRVSEIDPMAIEYTRGMSDARWQSLTVELPQGSRHGLVVTVPASDGGQGVQAVHGVSIGDEIQVGGYTIRVDQLSPQPPFAIITTGYESATSSVAVVHVTAPDGEEFDRWVYHRFNEINQDMLAGQDEQTRPTRSDADPGIEIRYVDASKLQTYIDERDDGSHRVIVRTPDGISTVLENIGPDESIEMAPGVRLEAAGSWEHAEMVERPRIVAEDDRDNSLVGTHSSAMLAIEIRSNQADWSKKVWLPFTRYMNVEMGTKRRIHLPDGRDLELAFGRLQRSLPSFAIQLVDFEMLAYDHRGAPRDYQSTVRVSPMAEGFQGYTHITRLNAPLQAPFMWSDERSMSANIAGRFISRLSPKQFKLSQSGWDAEGWKQSQLLVDQGLAPRAIARFTILHVGNNPGIHIIALGSVFMGLGIPWAFYIKPALVKAKKKKIKAQVAAGTYKAPAKKQPQPSSDKREPVGAES